WDQQSGCGLLRGVRLEQQPDGERPRCLRSARLHQRNGAKDLESELFELASEVGDCGTVDRGVGVAADRIRGQRVVASSERRDAARAAPRAATTLDSDN